MGEGVHAGGDDGAFAFLLGATLGGLGAIGGEGGDEGVKGLGGGALAGFALGEFGDGGKDALALGAEIGGFAALEGDGFFDFGEATLGFDVAELGLGGEEFGFGQACAHTARFRAAGGEIAHETVAFGLEFGDVGGTSVFFADAEEVVPLIVETIAGAERTLVLAGDAGEPVLGFAEFGPGVLLFEFEGGDGLGELFPLGGELLGFAFEGAELFAGVFEVEFQFVEFSAALKDAGALVFGAAAGNGTGAVDDFAVEGNEAVPALGFGEGEGDVEGFDDDDAAEEGFDDGTVLGGALGEGAGLADDSGATEDIVEFAGRSAGAHEGEGLEGRASGLLLFEELDGGAGFGFARHDEVVGGTAESGFNGEGMVGVHVYGVSDGDVGAGEQALLGGGEHGASAGGAAVVGFEGGLETANFAFDAGDFRLEVFEAARDGDARGFEFGLLVADGLAFGEESVERGLGGFDVGFGFGFAGVKVGKRGGDALQLLVNALDAVGAGTGLGEGGAATLFDGLGGGESGFGGAQGLVETGGFGVGELGFLFELGESEVGFGFGLLGVGEVADRFFSPLGEFVGLTTESLFEGVEGFDFAEGDLVFGAATFDRTFEFEAFGAFGFEFGVELGELFGEFGESEFEAGEGVAFDKNLGFGGGLAGFCFVGLADGVGEIADEEPFFEEPEFIGDGAVAASDFGFYGEGSALDFDFGDDIADALELGVGGGEAALGVLAAPAVALHTGSFVHPGATLLGAGGESLVNFALTNDGVARAPEAGVGEEVGDIAEAAVAAVDLVVAVALAVQAAGDADFGGFDGELAVFVIEDEGDFGVALGASVLCSVEDDFLGVLGADVAGVGFAETPEDGVHDVGFAAPVGADHSRDALADFDVGAVGKGFEPVDANPLEAHGVWESRRRARRERSGSRDRPGSNTGKVIPSGWG